MTEKEFQRIKNLIDKDIQHQDFIKLARLKIYLADQLSKNMDVKDGNILGILDLPISHFIKREIKFLNKRLNIPVNNVTHSVASYRGIPNNLVKVFDLIDIDVTWLENQNRIGPNVITDLELLLNRHNLSMYSLNSDYELIEALNNQRQLEHGNILGENILNENLTTFLFNNSMYYDYNIFARYVRIFTTRVGSLCQKPDSLVTVKDAWEHKQNLEQFTVYPQFYDALKNRYHLDIASPILTRKAND